MKNTYTVTFHSVINYGALLQAIALQNVIIDIGFKNNIIDYRDKIFEYYNPLNFNNISFLSKIKKLIKLIIFNKRLILKYNKFQNFINENMILTERVHSIEDINKYIDSDAILLTGSDQVWSYDILNGLSNIYTLNFGYSTNSRISYAASIGVNNLPSSYEKNYEEKLKVIDCMSVREESAKNILNCILPNKNIDVVLDPTLLLSSNQWNSLINKNNFSIKEKYIVAYTMDKNPEYIKIVNYISKITGLKIVFFDLINPGFKNVLLNAYTSDPFEFLNIIKNAEYVVTNSFHGTVFSIIFEKKLWVVPHLLKGTRMIDLLKLLGLDNRIVYNLEDIEKTKYNEEINYNKVNLILNDKKNDSIEWLRTNLFK